MSARALVKSINDAVAALAFVIVLIVACVNFDNTATFWKCMGLLAFWLLLDIADELRKIRRGERADA